MPGLENAHSRYTGLWQEDRAVAADGVVLGPGLITGSLPAISEGQGLVPQVGRHVQGASLLAELAILGAEPKPQTPEEFGRYINADVAKWSKLVKDNDVQLPGGK